MRQALAKGKRRELRRAMGEGALGHIQSQDQAVAILQNAVASCQREIAALAVNHADSRRSAIANLGVAFENIGDERARLDNFIGRSFLSRLRWLFTGK